jgi:hypothetical protein
VRASEELFRGVDRRLNTTRLRFCQPYLGGFIGEKEAQDIWIQEKVLAKWAGCGRGLASVAVNYPQSPAYRTAEVSAAG